MCTRRHPLWILQVSGIVDKSVHRVTGDLRRSATMVTLINYERVTGDAAQWRPIAGSATCCGVFSDMLSDRQSWNGNAYNSLGGHQLERVRR